MFWTAAGCVLLMLVGAALIQFAVSRSVVGMFEGTPPLNPAPSLRDSRAEEFECDTTDGLKLRGALFRQHELPCRGLVLFCHELGGDCWSALNYAEALFNTGFDVLAFDFRNHGQSDSLPDYSPLHWMTRFELEDVQAVLRYIDERPDLCDLPLGIFGISRGGSAALAAAGTSRKVRCVACDSAYSTRLMTTFHAQRWLSLVVGGWLSRFVPAWHIEVTLWGARKLSERRRKCRYEHLSGHIGQLADRDVLLISGSRDNYVLPEVSSGLFKQISAVRKELWTVAGARHNQARNTQRDEYDRRLIRFFSVLSPVVPVDSPATSPVAGNATHG